jgi:heme a synthase
MGSDSVASYNQNRFEVDAVNPITAFQIGLQMVHRLVALLIFCAVSICAWSARWQLSARHPIARLALVWFGLIVLQVILGASTIWSHKAADVATTHVVVGALSLVAGALLTIVSFRVLIPVRVAALAATEPAQASFVSRKPVASSAK